MKRPRFYKDDLDDANSDKMTSKDWPRRGVNLDRRRRFHPNGGESSRKGGSSSSSYDRSFGDDQEPSKVLRRRFEDDADGFDRRMKGFSRHHDGSDHRSPRGGGERLNRSESFSAVPRREVRKGFRSERTDRSWSTGRGEKHHHHHNHNAEADDGRGVVRSRDSSSGEQSKRGALVTTMDEKVPRESCSSSEMEEGELKPDAEPDGKPVPPSLENNPGREVEDTNFDEDKEEEDSLMIRVKIENHQKVVRNDDVKEMNDEGRKGEGQGEQGEVNGGSDDGNLGGKNKEIRECVDDARGAPPPPAAGVQEDKHRSNVEIETDVEDHDKKEGIAGLDFDIRIEKKGGFDLEAKSEEGTVGLPDSSKECVVAVDDDNQHEATLNLMTEEGKENHRDKGKGVAISLADKEDSVENVEGPSSKRGFELVFSSDAEESCGRAAIGNHKDNLKLELCNLSLGLPGTLSGNTSKHPNPKPSSPNHARSIQSLPSSLRVNSDEFTTSISFSGSQTFVHNPSCSLTQNSFDNFEQSVGSHPIFQRVESTIWQAQSSKEPKWNVGPVPFTQRMLLAGNTPYDFQALSADCHPKAISPTQSRGSCDTKPNHSKDKRLLMRGRSSGSLYRSERQEKEPHALNGVDPEKIVSKIVLEPLNVAGRILQEMTDHSVEHLKGIIREMVVNADKREKLHALQEVLRRRSDLTAETMSKSPRPLLGILVALKTGLPNFLRSNNNLPTSDLVEIFLNLKCCNLACRSILPVDDCDCKVCTQKGGFCSACMCLVCSKFDMASNSCSWVGCDVCLHWCHTECGLRESHIRNGPTSSGAERVTEMQFHCIACDHPSEMFGFIKDVFTTCAMDWKAEMLAKELQCVRRIFSSSKDAKGKKLCEVAGQMLGKLDEKTNLFEVINSINIFFSESETSIRSTPSRISPKEPSRHNAESTGTACPSTEPTWLLSSSLNELSHPENKGIPYSIDRDKVGKQISDAELQTNHEKMPPVDDLESVVRFKQAEARMYQERSDSARNEAESLKRIAVAKSRKIEEDYAVKIAKLQLKEAEERRRRKLEELQVIEKVHREYSNMKMRMEADINDLLLKMEVTRQHLIT